MKSQIVTLSWGGKRKLPYAFTEQGIWLNEKVNSARPPYDREYFRKTVLKPLLDDGYIRIPRGLREQLINNCKEAVE